MDWDFDLGTHLLVFRLDIAARMLGRVSEEERRVLRNDYSHYRAKAIDRAQEETFYLIFDPDGKGADSLGRALLPHVEDICSFVPAYPYLSLRVRKAGLEDLAFWEAVPRHGETFGQCLKAAYPAEEDFFAAVKKREDHLDGAVRFISSLRGPGLLPAYQAARKDALIAFAGKVYR